MRDRAQRNAYARGAKALWNNLSMVATEGAWVDVYTPAFERFLRRFDTPLTDPVLQAGHRRPAPPARVRPGRLLVRHLRRLQRRATKVREFKIGGSHGVAGDYYAGKIYNDFVRYVSSRQAKAARAHTGARATRARSTPRASRLAALGGNEGYANYFPFAFKG